MYRLAGRALQGLEDKEGSLIAISLAVGKDKGKKVYALAVETLKRHGLIQKVVDESKVLSDVAEESLSKLRLYSLYVAVYELLFGRRELEGRGWPVNIVKKNASLLRSIWKDGQGASRSHGTKPESSLKELDVRVRYVRVNTLKGCCDSVCAQLKSEGFTELENAQFLASLQAGQESLTTSFTRDGHIPGLLLFPHKSSILHSRLHKNGSLFLQDKASCLPAYILSPSCGSHVIDACAAPGNKTTHLAAILNNNGRIDAFEIDPKRTETLKNTVSRAGASCVNVHCQDFLSVDPGQYSTVTHVLVDPSCSGSGMKTRVEHPGLLAQGPDLERLDSLARFQTRVLLHALSFPSVEQVVYSTCSIHTEENENVVQAVLNQVKEQFELVQILPHWPTRGLPTFTQGPYCIRTDPSTDLTGGFFVALFRRIPPAQSSGKENGLEGNVCQLEDGSLRKRRLKCSSAKRKRMKLQPLSFGKRRGMCRGRYCSHLHRRLHHHFLF